MVWGEVVEADLRCGVGEFRVGGFVALWSVSEAERVAKKRKRRGVCVGRFWRL